MHKNIKKNKNGRNLTEAMQKNNNHVNTKHKSASYIYICNDDWTQKKRRETTETRTFSIVTSLFIIFVFARGLINRIFCLFVRYLLRFSSSQPLSLIICTSSMIYLPSLYFWLVSNACSLNKQKKTIYQIDIRINYVYIFPAE